MAIKYKTVKDKLEKTPLSEFELQIIDFVERDIDKIISDTFRGEDIKIELSVANFTRNSNGKVIDLPKFRQGMMMRELERRYHEAGWETSVLIDDSRGMNQNPDYFVLRGKK